ncbi:MAG TPA: hypothetical protein VE136_11765 [Anaerolineales bacterium]|jgi:hypothetical protein|nr:hypothetical protein [Anaerolineales bacterium]
MNNLLNGQPILYDAVTKQQYDRLQKQAASARALRRLAAKDPDLEGPGSTFSLKLKALTKAWVRIPRVFLASLHASVPGEFKKA